MKTGDRGVTPPSWVQAEDAPEKLRSVFEPIVGRLSKWFTPRHG